MKLISSEKFDYHIDDKLIKLFTLENSNGIVSQITNYGGRIVNLFTPDLNGNFEDIVLGYDSIEDYLFKPEYYFGAIIGRYGNRISNGRFKIGNDTYKLNQNEGKHTLHGGQKGFHNVVWNAKQISKSKIELSHHSNDGEQGFPGNLKVKVTYILTDNNELKINYEAISDKPTHINLTHHSYFNLSGFCDRIIENHILQINANEFTIVDSEMIPTGETKMVENTAFDFRTPKKIGLEINDESVVLFGGFDHNFVLNKKSELKFSAQVLEPVSCRTMDVWTTEPAIQFYSGNFIEKTKGKEGAYFDRRTGFCLETQHFPDTPNNSNFPSTLLSPGKKFKSSTVYKFGIKKE